MTTSSHYKTITREQFLFHEMRITARQMANTSNKKNLINEIADNNLFQFPTERMIRNIANVCYNRLESLDSSELIELIGEGSISAAKQTCLYAMMCSNRLIWDFMSTVIAEKFRTKDFHYSRRDLNSFFTRLQEQNDEVASWSDGTVKKCKSVLNRMLIETEYLDSSKSEQLNPVLIDQELKRIMLEKKDYASLAAFNCFEEV